MSIRRINSQVEKDNWSNETFGRSFVREKGRGILLNSRPLTSFHMRWGEVEERARLRYICIYPRFLCMRVYIFKSKLSCRRGRSFQSRLYLVELSREPASSSSSLPERTPETHLCVGFAVEVFPVFFFSLAVPRLS